MKKIFVLLLLLVYGFSSTGMTLNLHYCCGKLKNVNWVAAYEKDCGTKDQIGTKTCCETKQINSKQKSDQVLVQAFAKQVKSFSEVRCPASAQPPVEQRIVQLLSPVAFAPPPLSSPPLFLLHCNYRI